MNILGLNAFHGDASAALLIDGQLVAALEEERLNRINHWAGFPEQAVRTVLTMCGIEQVEHVAISRDPRAHFWSKLARVMTRPGDWARLTSRAKNSVEVARLAGRLSASGIAHPDRARVHFVEHHRAHLACALLVSPFVEPAVVSI